MINLNETPEALLETKGFDIVLLDDMEFIVYGPMAGDWYLTKNTIDHKNYISKFTEEQRKRCNYRAFNKHVRCKTPEFPTGRAAFPREQLVEIIKSKTYFIG